MSIREKIREVIRGPAEGGYGGEKVSTEIICQNKQAEYYSHLANLLCRENKCQLTTGVSLRLM